MIFLRQFLRQRRPDGASASRLANHRSLNTLPRPLRWLWLLTLLSVLLLGGWLLRPPQESGGTNPVIAAWQEAQARGAYHFDSDVTQITTPLATLTNIGRTSHQTDLHLQGETDLHAAALNLRLWSQAGSVTNPDQALEVRVADGKTMARQGDGEWKEVGDLTGPLAPGGDFLAFLAGLRDLQTLGSETRAGITFTRYRFQIDGPAVADYLRNQMEQTLQQRGELPPGMRLQSPEQYAHMNGQGEIWIDSQGLPLRQMLDVTFPPQRDEQVSGRIVTTFHTFAPLPATTFWRLDDWVSTAATAAGLLLGFGFCLVVVTGRRSRQLYAALVTAIIFANVTGPLLQNLRIASFVDTQTARAADTEQMQSEQEMARTARELATAPTFDPLVNPLADTAATANTPPLLPQAPTPEPLVKANDNTDSDQDGLTDFLEERIGTDYNSADTDGDSINDGQEVLGFTHNGHTWYGDPFNRDSNNDGQPDTLELRADRNQDHLPDDTDDDGTPDAFDDDNDGDGVVDRFDTSPYTRLHRNDAGAFFNETAPFQLQLDNLEAGKPVYVDFQLRPGNEKHLWYALNVLDWPHDVEAQFQDGDNVTYADLPNADPVANPADANGDLKLIPMLEIRMSNAAANLPGSEELLAYNTSVNEVDANNKVAYVPLRILYDEKSGQRIAFQARMPYLATGSWSQPHEVRVVWLVQALSDYCSEQVDGICVTYSVQNQPQVIQSYYDDWFLTGLSVREEHGADLAVIYEDPAVDNNPKDDGALIALSHGLDEAFLSARDQDNNGQRDITTAELHRRFDHPTNGNVALEERWGISNTLRVEHQSYGTLDRAVMTTAMTETMRILNANFTTPWQQDNSLKPLLMMAHEDRFRSQGLDTLLTKGGPLSKNGALLTVDMKPLVTPLSLSVGVKWTLYCSAGGATPAWRACDATEQWEEIGSRYGDVAAQAGDDETMALGRLGLVRFYFMALAQGVVNLILQDATIIVPNTGFANDTSLTGTIRNALRGGAGSGSVLLVSVITRSGALQLNELLRAVAYAGGRTTQQQLARLGSTGLILTKIKNLWANGGKTKIIVGAVIVAIIAVAAIGTLIFFKLSGNPLLEKIASGAIVIAIAVASLYSLVNVIVTTVQVVQGLELVYGAATALQRALTANSALAGTTRAALVVGAVIQIAVVWGFFIYQMVDSQTTAFSPEFNAALAQVIAATILIITLAVLSATVIGLIIVTIIAVIDAILTAICELGVDDLREVPGLDGACFTLNTAATALLAKALYSYDSMIDTERDEMVSTAGPDVQLANPERGYVADNPVTIVLPVTTTVAHKDPEPENWGHILPYIWLFSRDNIRSTTFRYELSTTENTMTVERNEMNDDWTVSEDHTFAGKSMFSGQARLSPESSALNLGAGLNRSPGLYLNTGYALPAYECWTIPNPIPPFTPPVIPICYVRTLEGDNSTLLEQLKLDILPSTLDGFVDITDAGDGGQRLSWDASFETLYDADGDGLRVASRQGIDPNDKTPDADGDGLSDGYELQWRQEGIPLSPIVWDTDSDGLTDFQELDLGSNPAIKDTDNDGLFDSEELYHRVYTFDSVTGKVQPTDQWAGGWTIAITGTQPLNLIVSSDPSLPDSDLDGISDQAEKELATNADVHKRLDPDGRPYHPLLVNKNPLVVYTAVNDSDRIVKPGQPLLYSTNVTNLGAPFAAGGLEVRAPALLGQPFSTYRLELDQSNSVTKTTNFVVANDAASQNVNINSFARARLVNLNPVPWRWLAPTSSPFTGLGKPSTSVAVAPSSYSRQDLYVLTASLRNSDDFPETVLAPHKVYRGDVRAWGYPGGETRNLEVDDNGVAGMRTRGGADVACNEEGNCFYVWDQYDNCTTVTVDAVTILTNNDETNGADIALYFNRNSSYLRPGESAEELLFNQANIATNSPAPVNRTVQWCGPNVSMKVWEYDDPSVLKGYSLSASSFSDHPDGTEDWRFSGTAQDGSVSVNVRVTRAFEKRNLVMGSLTGQTPQSLARTQFALTQDTTDKQTTDYSPVIASDGVNFLAVWERVSAVFSSGQWRMSSQIVARRYDNQGKLSGNEVLLSPKRVLTSASFSPQSYTNLDVAWIGDAYRVVWRYDFEKELSVVDFDAAGNLIADSQRVLTNGHAGSGFGPHLAYDPHSGRHLIVYNDTSFAPRGLLLQNRNDAGVTLPLAANGIPNVSYHPGLRGWLLLISNGVTKEFTYELLNPDGTPMSLLTRQTSEWTQFSSGVVNPYALACPVATAQPALVLPFEELPGATSFADTSGNGLVATCSGDSCPLAGVDGAPQAPLSDYGLLFNGVNQKLTTSVPGVNGATFSVGLWFKVDAAETGDRVLLDGGNWSVYLRNDRLYFLSNGQSVASQPLTFGNWQHLVVAQDMVKMWLYLNGQVVDSRGVQGAASITAPMNLTIGAAADNSRFFQGVIDQLQVWDTGLDANTVEGVVNRTLNSYCLAAATGNSAVSAVRLNLQEQDTRGGVIKANAGLNLTIDAVPPTSTVDSLVDGGRIQGVAGGSQTIIMGGSAHDAYGIQGVEVSVNGGPFQPANGAATWTFPLQIGEGRHTIQSRAIDVAGNVESDLRTTTIIVDGAGPQLSMDLTVNAEVSAAAAAAGTPVRQPVRGADNRWRLFLQGAVNDPAVGNDAGSTIAKVELLLQSDQLNTSGNAWQTVNLAGNQWNINYEFAPGLTDVSGLYTMTVQATDAVGNVASLARLLQIDSRGPEAILSAVDANRSILNAKTVKISGVVSDTSGVANLAVLYTPIQQVVALSDTLLLLPFDEASDAQWFKDRTTLHHDAICVTPGCVVGGEAGRLEKAVRFSGQGPLHIPNSQDLDVDANRSLSLQSWLRTEQSDGVLVSKQAGGVGYALRVQGGKAALQLNGAAVVASTVAVNDNQWHHVVGVVDRAAGQALLYVDGVLQGSVAFSDTLANGGVVAIGGQTEPAPAYVGWLDEVAIFQAALSPFLVKALYETTTNTVISPATLAQPGLPQTTWSAAVPLGLEGQYQIDLRGVDGFNHAAISGYSWRGLIDTLAPRINFTAQATGNQFTDAGGSAKFEIAYSYRAEDRYLSDSGFSGPCDGRSALLRDFADDAAMNGLFPDLTLRNRLSTSCTVWESSAAPATTVKACDLYGNCTTTTPEVTVAAANASAANAELPRAVIVAPTSNQVVAIRDGNLSLTLVAEAAQALREVTILVDNNPVQSISFTQAEAVKKVQRTVTVALPALTEGAHTLAARATEWSGAVQQTLIPLNFTADLHDPVATLTNEKITAIDAYALGNSMMRLRGQASDTLGLAAVQLSVNDGPFADVTFEANGEWSTAVYLGDEPAGKSFKFTVRSTDLAGRTTDLVKQLVTEVQPLALLQTTITAAPASPTSTTTAVFHFTGVNSSGGGVAGFQCQLDGSAFAPCTSPVTYSGLSNGEHIFRVLATDGKGEVDPSPALHLWTVDTGFVPSPPVNTQRALYLPIIRQNSRGVVAAGADWTVSAVPAAEAMEEATPTPVDDAATQPAPAHSDPAVADEAATSSADEGMEENKDENIATGDAPAATLYLPLVPQEQ